MQNFKLPSNQHVFFYGMRRSGNHAVLDWLLHNFSGDNTRFKIKHRLMASGNSCYLNAVNEYIQRRDSWIDYSFAKFTYKNIIVTFEDTFLDYNYDYAASDKKIVIVRDIKNIVASRLQKLRSLNTPWENSEKSLFNLTEKGFWQKWLSHANVKPDEAILIVFDKWVKSIEYRDSICNSLGIKNADIIDRSSTYGGGSSFKNSSTSDNNNVLKRSELIEMPKEIIKRMEQDDILEARLNLNLSEL